MITLPFNYDWVTDRIALGSEPNSTADINKLLNDGITHILDTCSEQDDSALIHASGVAKRVEYLWNPTNDDGQTKLPNWFKPSLDFAIPALLVPQNKIYVHCVAGVNRSASTVYAILRAFGIGDGFSKAIILAHRIIDIVGIRYAKDADRAVIALGYVR